MVQHKGTGGGSEKLYMVALSTILILFASALYATPSYRPVHQPAGKFHNPRCDISQGCTIQQIAHKRRPKRTQHTSLREAWGKQHVELEDIVSILNKTQPITGVVNVGARDGKDHDPCYPLFAKGAYGAAFEGDTSMWPALDANLAAFPNVKVVKEFVYPHSLPHKLVELGLATSGPRALDVLKIDIDVSGEQRAS